MVEPSGAGILVVCTPSSRSFLVATIPQTPTLVSIYKQRHASFHKPVWLCTRVYMFSMALMHNTAFFRVQCTILRLHVASSRAMHAR